jgi:hypothetical protein
MFRYLDEILGSSVGEEVNPFFWAEGRSREVRDEVVVDVVTAVGGEVVLVGFFWGVGP